MKERRMTTRFQTARRVRPGRAGLVLFCLLLLAAGCPSKPPQDANAPGRKPSTAGRQTAEASPSALAYYRYRVIKEYPHDPCDFTQGLVYDNGFLYEGTGLYGQSRLTQRDFTTLQIVKQIRLPSQYFGEGVALVGNRIIQLTWQEHTGFVYDKNTLHELTRFSFATEGWGLTYDGRRLILSDGSDRLFFLDPNTYAPTGQVRVTDRGRPLREINELEYIDGAVYANILGANYIAIIAPQTGAVTGWIDLTGLYTPPVNPEGNFVLNGIAWLPKTRHLLVTGKCWTKMFEIELVRKTP